MEEHYLFLSSEQSKDLFPSNHPGDFTVELPHVYDLEGHWTCAVKEIQIPLRTDIAYVCTDICVESYAENTMVPVLRTLQKASGKSVMTYFLYESPIHVKVKEKALNRIRIFIRDSQLNPVTFDKITRCTLQFTKWK